MPEHHAAQGRAPSAPVPTDAKRDYCTLAEIRDFYGSVTWAWNEHIPTGHLSLVGGETDVGKSFCLASGFIAPMTGSGTFPDGSRPAKIGKVMLVETEEMRGIYAQRLRELGVGDNDVVFPHPDPTYLPRIPADAERIAARARDHNCSAIVVDSLSGGHSLDENSADMRSVMQTLMRLAGDLQIPVVAAHHFRKLGAMENRRATLDRLRGSSVISQFARAIYGMWRPDPESDAVRVDCLKMTFGPKPPSFGFRITRAGLQYCDPPDEPTGTTATDLAAEFLRVELAREPQRYGDLKEKADKLGISRNALYRARDAIGVVTEGGLWQFPVFPTD